jgi:hypothetical protein
MGRALQTHRAARPGSRTNLAREFKVSMSATMFFT